MTNTQKENSQEEKCMAVCIFQKCCSSMSGFIFSSTVFFAPQGMESISHPFKPWAGLCVCVCVCVCMLSCSVASNSLRPHGLLPVRLLCYGILQARILVWLAVPCSRGYSRPRDWTHVSWVSGVAGRFFTTSPTWEAPGRLARLQQDECSRTFEVMLKRQYMSHLTGSVSMFRWGHQLGCGEKAPTISGREPTWRGQDKRTELLCWWSEWTARCESEWTQPLV